MADPIAEIEARAKAAQPGPWHWWGNTESRQVRLMTIYHGERGRHGIHEVLGFKRWGMQSAQPRFMKQDGLLYDVEECGVIYQVCPEAESKSDPRVYRQDFLAIRHPDAEFIAHARQDVDTLIARVRELESQLANTRVRLQENAS